MCIIQDIEEILEYFKMMNGSFHTKDGLLAIFIVDQQQIMDSSQLMALSRIFFII